MTSTTAHTLYPSLDALLSPEALSQIAGHAVTEITVEEREVTNSSSGSPFLSITTQGARVKRYVVKRVNWTRDWFMRAFDDRLCREVQLWASGLLDRLPPEIKHAIVACAQDGDGWSMLMTDYGHLLPGEGEDIAIDESSNYSYLNALAALHARYLDDPALLDPALGLCETARYLTGFSPGVVANVTDGDTPQFFNQLWDRFDACFTPETVRVVRALHADPQPLCTALQQFPQTLVHGDWAGRNLAIDPQLSPRVLAIDWQFALRGAAVLDLFRYLILTTPPIPRDESIRYYRERYEFHTGTALDDDLWEAQVELGTLGIFVLFGGIWFFRGNRDPFDELPALERRIQAGSARL